MFHIFFFIIGKLLKGKVDFFTTVDPSHLSNFAPPHACLKLFFRIKQMNTYARKISSISKDDISTTKKIHTSRISHFTESLFFFFF